MAFGEVMMPMTEHSAQILVGSWPSQSVMTWSGFAMTYSQTANNLFTQLNTQYDIKDILAPMEGAFIDSARALAAGRETALQNRIECYRYISKQAHWAANELHSTKADLAEIVNKAEEDVQTSRDDAEQAKAASAAVPGAVAAIEAQLEISIAMIVARAKGEATARDSQGATTVTALSTDIAKWTAPFVNNILPESGGVPDLGGLPSTPAPPLPQDGASATPVDHSSTSDNLAQHVDNEPDSQNTTNAQRNNVQQTAARSDPDAVKDAAAKKPSMPSSSPATSAPSPSSGGSSSSSPASVLGQMMQSGSSGGSSPASSASSGSSGGAAGNPAGATQSGQLTNASAAGPGGGASAAGAGRAPGLASLGSGLAGSSARMASGAISAATNAGVAGASVGGQVAQNVAPAAAQAAPVAGGPAAATTPAGGAAMPMMPPGGGAGGPGPVSSVTSGPPVGGPNVGGAPSMTPAAVQPMSSGGLGAPASSMATGGVAPLAMPRSSVGGIGADGAMGDVLFDQAMDAGRDVVSALIAQTRGTGYISIDYAVSLIWERSGTVAAWMATSEGASCIPLGVRIPQEVRLAVTDPVVGRELWDATAAAGGASPLEVVVRHAEAREAAEPGARVLAIASSLPMGLVIDWAGAVGARPVSVDPKKVGAASDLEGALLHRCAVAMPWEWRQANAFTGADRLKVAARHMHMAANAGHLSGRACETVMRLFEERKPIDDALWGDVRKERFLALIDYELAVQMRGNGGADPARALATVRAAEVIECLRHYDTAEGCADLLYATRLAGAPLNPAAAVA